MSGMEVPGKGQLLFPPPGTMSSFWGGIRMAEVLSPFPPYFPLAELG